MGFETLHPWEETVMHIGNTLILSYLRSIRHYLFTFLLTSLCNRILPIRYPGTIFSQALIFYLLDSKPVPIAKLGAIATWRFTDNMKQRGF